MHTVSTIRLFDLFYRTGLLKSITRAVETRKVRREDFTDYNEFKAAHAHQGIAILGQILDRCGVAPPLKLVEAMNYIDSLRLRPPNEHFECIHTNDSNDPIAYVSAAPCFNDDVWLVSHLCSAVTGHGVSIMVDVMKEVITNDAIKYVVGIFNSKYERSARIWKLAYEIMDNTEICDLASYKYWDSALHPYAAPLSKLYFEAFGRPDHKIAERNMALFAHEEVYDTVLFKVCEESKEKFKQLFN